MVVARLSVVGLPVVGLAVAGLSFEPGSWWAYLAVFLAAATPVIEVLVVVPAAVLAGMEPISTAAVALVGNLSTVVLTALAGDRLLGWFRARRTRRRQRDVATDEHLAGGSVAPGAAIPEPEPSRRAMRARQLATRWGVPGLGLLAPLTTGTHIATVAALAIETDRGRVLRWMTIGLALWAGLAAVLTAAGLELFT